MKSCLKKKKGEYDSGEMATHTHTHTHTHTVTHTHTKTRARRQRNTLLQQTHLSPKRFSKMHEVHSSAGYPYTKPIRGGGGVLIYSYTRPPRRRRSCRLRRSFLWAENREVQQAVTISRQRRLILTNGDTAINICTDCNMLVVRKTFSTSLDRSPFFGLNKAGWTSLR